MPARLKAILAAAVLVALLAGAQGTAALWRAQGAIQGGTVTTGNLVLLAGNGTTTAASYAFTQLNTSALVPGGFAQAPLTISNGGTTDLAYTLNGASTAPAVPTAADKALAAAAVLTIRTTTDAAACTAGGDLGPSPVLYSGTPGASASFSAPQLLPAGSGADSQLLCVRVGLPAGAPQGAAGGVMDLVLSFRGDQK
jgi:alternate signal-mediated exported protein